MPSTSLHLRGTGGSAIPVDKLVTRVKTFLAGRRIRVCPAELDTLPDPKDNRGRLGIAVFNGSGGWRSLMLSDFELLAPLAAQLSELFDGAALIARAVYGDSWCYELYEHGKQVSEFDSKQFRARQDELNQTAPPVEVPPGVLELASRMRQGHASEQEVHQLADYMSASPNGATVIAAAAMSEALGMSLEEALGMLPGDTVESALTSERQAALQPYLVDGNGEDELREVLDEDSAVPDATLSRFLPLLGIEADYADLEYKLIFIEHWHDPADVLPDDLEVARFLLGENE